MSAGIYCQLDFFYRSQFPQRLCALHCGLADGFSLLLGDQTIDLLQKKDDHRSSVLQGSSIWPQTLAAVVSRPVYFQRSDLADPMRLQQLLADVETCSVPDWHVDVHAHCAALVAVLRSALARHVPLRVVHRTPSATEPASLATVTLRRYVRYTGRTLDRTRQLIVLRTLFSTWAVVSKPSAALSHIQAMYDDLGLQLLQL